MRIKLGGDLKKQPQSEVEKPTIFRNEFGVYLKCVFVQNWLGFSFLKNRVEYSKLKSNNYFVLKQWIIMKFIKLNSIIIEYNNSTSSISNKKIEKMWGLFGNSSFKGKVSTIH